MSNIDAKGIGREEILALFIVFFISFGIWSAIPKAGLPQFEFASHVQDALLGKSAPFAAQVAASAEPALAGVTGASPDSPFAISSFLLLASPIILGLIAVFLYCSLRIFGFSRSISALSSLLFSLSFAALPLLPGMLDGEGIGALFFSLFLLFFALSVKKENLVFLLPVAAFAFLSGYSNPAFSIAGIVCVLLLGNGIDFSDRKKIAMQGALIVLFAASATLFQNEKVSFSVVKMLSAFSLSPFLFAAASCAAVLFFFSKSDGKTALFVACGVFAFGFSPLAGAMLLVFPAADGISRLMKETPKAASLVCAFSLAFFLIFGLFPPGTSLTVPVVASFLIASVSPLLLHFYEYRNRAFFASFACLLLAASAFSAVFFQLPIQREYYPKYIGADFAAALSYLHENGAGSISTLERGDATAFYLKDAKFGKATETSDYLLEGKNALQSGYLMVSFSSLGNLSTDFEIYRYTGNASMPSSEVAVFVSDSGKIITREIAQDGTLALKDGDLRDRYGQYYASVPLPRMVMLSGSLPHDNPANRMVFLSEEALPPHIVKLYSGEDARAEDVHRFGEVFVFRMK